MSALQEAERQFEAIIKQTAAFGPTFSQTSGRYAEFLKSQNRQCSEDQLMLKKAGLKLQRQIKSVFEHQIKQIEKKFKADTYKIETPAYTPTYREPLNMNMDMEESLSQKPFSNDFEDSVIEVQKPLKTRLTACYMDPNLKQQNTTFPKELSYDR